jgi:hypothetical protein
LTRLGIVGTLGYNAENRLSFESTLGLRRLSIMLLKKGFLACSLVLLLVSLSPAKPRRAQRLASGLWGGSHIRMNVSANSATIEYDCAEGTIAGPLLLDSKGRFTLQGTHLRARGGPIRSDETANQRPAVYTGSIKGERMTLTVRITGTNETVGTFSLTHGEEGSLFKCM